MPEEPRVAVVIDALPSYRGAERVLASALEIWPQAEVHTLIYEPAGFRGTQIAEHRIHTSFIQDLPGGRSNYRSLLPLLPMAIEGLDVQDADIVLSFNYAVANGVRCRPDQLHMSYTFAPLRYAWQDAGKYFRSGLSAPAARMAMHFFRPWDRRAAQRVHHMLAISKWTADCIRQAYQREAEVIYPPVETALFQQSQRPGEYFVAFSRLVRQKRLDVVVEAFTRLGLPLLVIGEGPERSRLTAIAGPNVTLVGAKSSREASAIVGRARALVHAAEEDFGLVMAEAQAAGRPVIAYGGGAAPEIVIDGKTGILFGEQTVESVIAAVRCFIEDAATFQPNACMENSQRFDKTRFQSAFRETVGRRWIEFQGQRARLKADKA